MSSSVSAEVKGPASETIEKKVYNIVENYVQYLPIVNDRNRLGFDLYKYVIGEGDEPLITISNAKVKLEGISIEELSKKISEEIKNINGKI